MRKEPVVKRKRASYTARKNLGLTLGTFGPLTPNQERVYASTRNLSLDGSAGSGKTFIAMHIGLDAIINQEEFSRLVIIRSNVETRKMGYLPGNDKEKIEVYEAPYMDIASELFDCGTAYDTLKARGMLHFMPTSFIRGTTLRDAFIIVDECQNMTYHELDSVITRVGQNCRIVFCGDYFQSDLKDTGIRPFHQVLKAMNEFDFVSFTTDDIVRSEFVKSYLVTKYAVHGDKQII